MRSPRRARRRASRRATCDERTFSTARRRKLARSILDDFYNEASVVLRDDRSALLNYLGASGAFWLAQDDDTNIGCIAFRPLPQIGPEAGEVKRLYVRPAHRGAQVADALLDALESHARAGGYRALYLDTHDGLQAALRFYTRRGYERIPRYNDNPQATIFMRRTLW